MFLRNTGVMSLALGVAAQKEMRMVHAKGSFDVKMHFVHHDGRSIPQSVCKCQRKPY